jgi:hypothetical protein
MSARSGRSALRHPILHGKVTVFSSSNAPGSGFSKTNSFELRRSLGYNYQLQVMLGLFLAKSRHALCCFDFRAASPEHGRVLFPTEPTFP